MCLRQYNYEFSEVYFTRTFINLFNIDRWYILYMDRKQRRAYFEIRRIKQKTRHKLIWVENFKNQYFFSGYRHVYQKQKLYTKIYRKQTDRQSFLHIESEHPKSFKDSIPYIQAIRIKRICTTSQDFEYHCKELKQQFLEHRFNS